MSLQRVTECSAATITAEGGAAPATYGRAHRLVIARFRSPLSPMPPPSLPPLTGAEEALCCLRRRLRRRRPLAPRGPARPRPGDLRRLRCRGLLEGGRAGARKGAAGCARLCAGMQAVTIATATASAPYFPCKIDAPRQALLMVANPTVQYAAYEFLAARLLRAKQARALLLLASAGGKISAGGGKASAAAAAAAAARRPPSLSAWEAFFAGALAKLAATLVTYPMLTIKSRQQMRTGPAAGGGGELLALFRAEGVAGLYRGIDTKLVQTVLTAAIMFSTKEQLTARKQAKWEGRERERGQRRKSGHLARAALPWARARGLCKQAPLRCVPLLAVPCAQRPSPPPFPFIFLWPFFFFSLFFSSSPPCPSPLSSVPTPGPSSVSCDG